MSNITKYKKQKKIKMDIPKEFLPGTIEAINRIEAHLNTIGVIYFLHDKVKMYTVPRHEEVVLLKRLPPLNDSIHRAVTEITATINTANPIVDRIMDDDSVEGVVMTNKEGAPILTNVSVTGATNYGRALHKFGELSQMYVKELNPTEELMIIRINTKKNEIMVAPDKEFSIVVIQHSRARRKVKDKREKNK